MTFEEMDISELPPTYVFAQLVDKMFFQWEAYAPTTVEADFPFGQDWWKYVYWMPKIKKEFYLMAIQSMAFEKDLQEMCINKYGMDYYFFTKHYRFFLKRLEWMRASGANHMGEVKDG